MNSIWIRDLFFLPGRCMSQTHLNAVESLELCILGDWVSQPSGVSERGTKEGKVCWEHWVRLTIRNLHISAQRQHKILKQLQITEFTFCSVPVLCHAWEVKQCLISCIGFQGFEMVVSHSAISALNSTDWILLLHHQAVLAVTHQFVALLKRHTQSFLLSSTKTLFIPIYFYTTYKGENPYLCIALN